jgi:PIN domain nuclease of toxin-antitoxin system
VSRYLLDTSAALLALKKPAQLKPEIRAAILAGPNILSVVSFWEVMLKSMRGKLKVGDPRLWWIDALEQLAATPLPLRPEHVAAVHELPAVHQDPFDRVLLAQATTEDLIVVTTDSTLARYRSERLQVLE